MSEYDVYLNSVGYMLAKRRDGQLERGAAQERQSNPFTRYLATDEQYVRVPFRFGDGGGCAEYDGSHRYAYGEFVDTHGGAVIGGPKIYRETGQGGIDYRVVGSSDGVNPVTIDTQGGQVGIGESFYIGSARSVRTAHILVKRYWMGDYSTVGDFTIAIYDDASGKPGSAVTNGSVSVSLKQDNDLFLPWPDRWRRGEWFWIEAQFPGDVSLSAATTYWFVVINNQAADLYWAENTTGGANYPRSVYNGTSWGTASNNYPLYYQCVEGSTASWPRCFCEHVYNGEYKRLYYGTGRQVRCVTTHNESSGTVTTVSSKILSAPVLNLKVFDGKLFAAQGPNGDVWYLSGATWTQLSGEQANALAVHDYMLWKADVASLKGSADGTTWTGAACNVGDPGSPVQAMVSHGGKLFCAKPEGIFEVTYPADYPGSTAPVANLMLDFSTELAPRTWMLDWHGGLYFPGYGGVYELKSGILRNLWTEKVDEGAQELSGGGSFTRPRRWAPIYDAAPGGWSAACGTSRGILFVHSDPHLHRAGLWWYDGRNWHDIGPVDQTGALYGQASSLGEYCLAVHLEDIGGGMGRLWMGEGSRSINFYRWPTWTNDRWMDSAANFRSDDSYSIASSIVCPKFTVEQRATPLQFCKVGVTGERGEADNTIKVYYRIGASTSWTLLGTATLLSDDYDELDFPASTTGRSVQLKAELVTAVDNTKSPRLEQLDLLYQPMPESFSTYQMIIHAAPDLPLQGGGVDPRSTNEILDTLRPLADSSGFTYIDPAGVSHTVRVTGMSIQYVRQEVAPGSTPPLEAYMIVSLLDV